MVGVRQLGINTCFVYFVHTKLRSSTVQCALCKHMYLFLLSKLKCMKENEPSLSFVKVFLYQYVGKGRQSVSVSYLYPA